MKRFVSLVLTFIMLFSCSIAVYAEPAELSVKEENNYWGYNGQTVLIDEFTTDAYTMKAFYDGEIVYVITVLANGETEFAWAPIGGDVRSITFMPNALNMTSDANALNLLSNENFVSEVKTYALSHLEESTIVEADVETEMVEVNSSSTVVPYAMNQADYNALINKLKSIYGSEHTWYNWTGMATHSVGGLTYEYKENLDYGMTYRDSVAYSRGMKLGSVIARILSLIPQVHVPMSVIANVLNVAAESNTTLSQNGQIANYYGSVSYARYVMVEGGGPYSECFRTITYDGWVDEGKPGSAELVKTGDTYSLSKEIFDSYELQRQRAYNSYT